MAGYNLKQLLSPERIPQLVQKYIRETLENDERCRAISGTIATRSITLEGMSLLEASNMQEEETRSLLGSVTRWLQLWQAVSPLYPAEQGR